MVKSREIVVVKFTAEKLLKIHESHRDFIISSSRACNQINYWKTYSLFERTDGDIKDPELSFVLNRITSQIWITVSSIVEYNRLASKYLGITKKLFPSLNEKLRKRFAPIAKEIGKYPIAARVRNSSIFHFDIIKCNETLGSFPKNHEFQFLFGNKVSEAVFPFADDIIFKSHTKDDDPTASEIWKLSLKTASDIVEFHMEFMMDIFNQYGLMSNMTTMNSRTDTVGDATTFRIPVFVDLESVEQRLRETKK